MVREFFNAPLLARNSFGIAASAERLVEFDSPADLEAIFTSLKGEWRVLGGGNNILLAGDVAATVLVPCARGIVRRGDELEVQAGTPWEEVVDYAATAGLWGVENLTLIPGTAGAAPVQNIGAYRRELRDVLVSVQTYVPGIGFKVFQAAECAFGYRESIFKHTRAVITSIRIRLSSTAAPHIDYADIRERIQEPTLQNIVEAIRSIRREKLPDPAVTGNAGSFFKNPVVENANKLLERYPDLPHYPAEKGVKLAAGWLIDRAGFKGYTEGHVAVHDRQALVLINKGGATGREVLDFARKIQSQVEEKFGVKIEMEVNVWGS